MRTMNVTALVLGAVLVGLVEGAPVPPGTRLTIELEKGRYAPFEPVVVDYSLRNTGGQPVEVPQAIDASRGLISFEVSDSTGRFHPYRTGLVACGMLTMVPLAPGAALTGEVRMVSNQFADLLSVGQAPGDRGAEFPFAEPGAYSIRARFALDGSFGTAGARILESNTLNFVVRKASSHEREALEFLPSRNELSIGLGGESMGGDAAQPIAEPRTTKMQRWEDFVDHFGDTPYAPFVRLTLASLYRSDGSLPMARPDMARTHLRGIVKTGPQFIVDDALLELAKTELTDGHTVEAQAAVTELLRSFPGSEHAKDAKRIAEGLKVGRNTLHEIFSN